MKDIKLNKKALKLSSKIMMVVFTSLFVVSMLAGTIMNENVDAVNSVMGGKTQETIQDPEMANRDSEYYKSAFRSVKEVKNNGARYAETLVAEGSTLLKNEKDALPLSKNAKVNLYSTSCANMVISGNGSSSADGNDPISLKEGLEAAGLDVNDDLYKWYEDNFSRYGRVRIGSSVGTQWFIGDAKWNEVATEAKTNEAEAAIFVVSRIGGEGRDAAMYGANTSNYPDDATDNNYLKLSPAEIDMLTNLKKEKDKGTFSKIIVLLNSANTVECDFIDNPAYGIDAAMWIGAYGERGAYAVGDLLAGNVNPSGKLSDTFFRQHRLNPVNTNAGMLVDDNDNFSSINQYEGRVKNVADGKNVVYQEGIYMGYRYTETRYEDVILGTEKVGDYDYEEVVSYPFGYGLSYTTFEYSDLKVQRNAPSAVDGTEATYTVSVKVTNTGKVEGKEAVQVYVQKPYTDYDKQYGIEKASVELVAFDKTDLLKPGASQTLTMTVNERDFASYDSYNAKTYIIDEGTYYLTAAKDCHAAINNILSEKGYGVAEGMTEDGNASLVWKTDLKFDSETYSTSAVTGNEITNQFDNMDLKLYEGSENKDLKYMTRQDWQGTVSLGWNEDGTRTYNQVDVIATDKMQEDLTRSYKPASEVVQPSDGEYPVFGSEKTSYSLIDMRAYDDGDDDPTNDERIPYDDQMWEDLLNQLQWEEISALLTHGFRMTYAIESINKPETIEHNGSTGPIHEFNTLEENGVNRGLAVRLQDPDREEVPTVYPCNGITASTYNAELCNYLGRQWGEDSLWAGRAGLYGMGVNIHRSQYSGRNFEYYSEDGFLTGTIAAEVTKGMATRGTYVYLKHAFLNDQESYRCGIFTWCNEQAAREIYLKAFQKTIEEGGAQCVMGGLNSLGVIWANEQGFMNTVLRDEFGMTGHVVTDTLGAHNGNYSQSILYGTDLPDGTSSAKDFDFARPDENGNGEYSEYAWAMREAAHRILYTVVHSNAMNGYNVGTRVIHLTPWWQTAIMSVQIVTGIIMGLSVVAWCVPYALDIKDNFRRKSDEKDI